MRIASDTPPLERAVRRSQNLRTVVTFTALLAVLWLLNLTPLPAMVCESFGLDRDYPASMPGRAFWVDCFGGPLGTLAAGSLPHPEELSYAPEADEFLAQLEALAAQEEHIEDVEAAQANAEGEAHNAANAENEADADSIEQQ